MKEIKSRKALFFDWDGTLSDSTTDSYASVCRIFERSSLIPPSFEEYARDFYHPYDKFYRSRGVTIPLDKIKQMYDEAAYHDDAPLYHDVVHIFSELWMRGIIIGIITANSDDRVRRQCRAHTIDGFVSYFICGVVDKTSAIRRLCAECTLAYADASYVGDFCLDITAARNTKVRAIGITRDKPTANILRSAGADHIIRDLYELIAIVDGV